MPKPEPDCSIACPPVNQNRLCGAKSACGTCSDQGRCWPLTLLRAGHTAGLMTHASHRGSPQTTTGPQRAPADESDPPIPSEATTNVVERQNGVGEEHHPKPPEGGVKPGRFEWEHVGVCMDAPDTVAALSLRPRLTLNGQDPGLSRPLVWSSSHKLVLLSVRERS